MCVCIAPSKLIRFRESHPQLRCYSQLQVTMSLERAVRAKVRHYCILKQWPQNKSGTPQMDSLDRGQNSAAVNINFGRYEVLTALLRKASLLGCYVMQNSQ